MLDNIGCVPVYAKALSPVISHCAQVVVGGNMMLGCLEV